MRKQPVHEFRRGGLAAGVLIGASLALSLVAYGVFLIPTTNALSIAAAVAILVGYGAVGLVLVPTIQEFRPRVAQVAKWAGLTAGTVFAVEVLMEYILLPKNNTTYGFVEFGLVLFIYFCAGGWLALLGQRVRDSVMGAALAASVSSLIWCIFVLATFYLFFASSRQKQVLRAEGDYDDFNHSGMSNFQAFIMEDFFGATFFHLLLGPLVAATLGGLGAVAARVLVRIRHRNSGG